MTETPDAALAAAEARAAAAEAKAAAALAQAEAAQARAEALQAAADAAQVAAAGPAAPDAAAQVAAGGPAAPGATSTVPLRTVPLPGAPAPAGGEGTAAAGTPAVDPAPVADPAAAADPVPPAGAPAATPTAGDVPGAEAAASGTSAGGDLDDPWVAKVAAAYDFPARVPVGSLMVDGSPAPAAQVAFPLAMMNRHGLVAGATGTGKTKTLQVLTEGLSAAGVPVFVADIKGDLSGLAVPGAGGEKLLSRTTGIGQDWQAKGYPVEFYTLGGLGTGTPIRTTVTDFGPLLLAKVLGLNATQESSLGLIFHWADQQGLALLDLKDLQSTIAHLVSDEGKAELKGIGGLSSATAGVILREIVTLQAQGGDVFFGEPAFATSDLLRTAADGRGVVSALELPAVQDRPALFSTFLMWLLADLFSELPEVGDVDRPRLVFFFDEAHLLFTGASKAFLTQVTQTVRLIRSKGVGIFFVTQTPKDVPNDVLAQLGSRVQHALRAHTPDDAAALRATVRTYPRSDYDLEQLLTSLGTGEAIVTVLSEKGVPTPVAWTRLRAPESSMDPMPAAEMERAVSLSPQHARYAAAIDRESAYELLAARAEQSAAEAAAEAERREQEAAESAALKEADRKKREQEKEAERKKREQERKKTSSRSRRASPLDSMLRSAGTQLGREITRTIFGTRGR